MLRNIPKILPPELVKTMMEMGHSDFMIIADANFPGSAHAKRIIRMDGVKIPELLEAVMQLFPLDTFVENPVQLMVNLPTEPVPKIWETYKEIVNKYDKDHAFRDFECIDRMLFYNKAENAYVIVQTGDESRYANIILQKGIC